MKKQSTVAIKLLTFLLALVMALAGLPTDALAETLDMAGEDLYVEQEDVEAFPDEVELEA